MHMLELTSAGVGAAAVSSSAIVCLVLALLRRQWQELTAQAAQRTGKLQRPVSLEGLNELMVRPRRKTGVVLALAAVLCVSPDSLFVRVANAATNPPNVRPYDAMLSKFLFMAAANAVAAAWLQRGATVKMVAGIRAGPIHVMLTCCLQAAVTIFNTLAFQQAEVTTALLGLSLSPLWAALFSRCALGERLPLRTRLALLPALGSTALWLGPLLADAAGAAPSDARSWLSSPLAGDAFGLLAGMSLGGQMTVQRSAALRAPQAALIIASLGGALLAGAFAAALALTHGHVPLAAATPDVLLVAAGNGLFCAASTVFANAAPRYTTGAEVGLILLLEMPLAPICIFAVFGDLPSSTTAAAALVLVCTLIAHELATPSEHGDGSEGEKEEVKDQEPQRSVLGSDLALNFYCDRDPSPLRRGLGGPPRSPAVAVSTQRTGTLSSCCFWCSARDGSPPGSPGLAHAPCPRPSPRPHAYLGSRQMPDGDESDDLVGCLPTIYSVPSTPGFSPQPTPAASPLTARRSLKEHDRIDALLL